MLETFVKQFTEYVVKYVKINNYFFLEDKNLDTFTLSQEVTLKGLYLGKEQKHVFIPSCNLLDIIAQHSNEKIIVNDLGELDFLYGNHLRKRHVSSIQGSLTPGTVKLVQNKYDENLGYGIYLGERKESTKILTHCIDRGIFIKRDKQLKK